MKFVLIVLSVLGIVVASMALHERYRTDPSPCSINDKWDCGIVNQSPYAMVGPIPVAAIGIAGYLVMGVLALVRAYRLLLVTTIAGLGFSLYLTNIEAHVLRVWCIYCVTSLVIISAMTLLVLVTAIVQAARQPRATTSA
jgi:vitamin-K-epoxide reductase (warfarin-sensitive)